jgi:glycosyltransferase involved in cell wall biosynthesis
VNAVASANVSFSVLVTCYNYKAFVEEAVDSALAQTRAALQVIVVDDGSTDGCTELLQARYGNDPRVTLLCGENGGQLVAFQRGVAAATGEVLCFLDADDRWAPDYLEKIGAVYDARRDVGFVFSDIALFGNEERVVGYAAGPLDLGYTAISTYVLTYWYGAPTSALSLRADYARRCLDLPADYAKTWRLSADNCLVYGASLLGARKYSGLRRQRARCAQVLPADRQRRLPHPWQQRLVVQPLGHGELPQPPAFARIDRPLRAHGRRQRLMHRPGEAGVQDEAGAALGRDQALRVDLPARRCAVLEAVRARAERADQPEEVAASR